MVGRVSTLSHQPLPASDTSRASARCRRGSRRRATGPKNGAADFDVMRERIESYRRRNGAPASQRPGDYYVGCIMVASRCSSCAA